MIATSVCARGLDIKAICLVVNFKCPDHLEDYIHRIGRTARAESDGVAITFVNQKEQHKFGEIEKLLEQEVHKGVVPIQFGEAPAYEPSKFIANPRNNRFKRTNSSKKK